MGSNSFDIGPVALDRPLLLAPMEDVSDLPFRVICKRLGADIVYTEFVNAEGLIREDPNGPQRTLQKLQFLPEERPFGIQIYGAAEVSMERATAIAAAHQPDLIDINCGCWVNNVALRGAGAGLLKDLGKMRQVVASVVQSTDLPVTVKTRLGWSGSDIRIVEVARMLEDLGVRALTVHCRTRDQGHKGPVQYEWIEKIKAAVHMPVVLNGDVVAPEDGARVFAETGCDGVMIGRGAIRHPWIFREMKHFIATGERMPPPSLEERVEWCRQHLRLALEHRPERVALASMRRHYSGYFRSLPGAAFLRGQLCQCKSAREVEAQLEALEEAEVGV